MKSIGKELVGRRILVCSGDYNYPEELRVLESSLNGTFARVFVNDSSSFEWINLANYTLIEYLP
jgi:hypothetical protein